MDQWMKCIYACICFSTTIEPLNNDSFIWNIFILTLTLSDMVVMLCLWSFYTWRWFFVFLLVSFWVMWMEWRNARPDAQLCVNLKELTNNVNKNQIVFVCVCSVPIAKHIRTRKNWCETAILLVSNPYGIWWNIFVPFIWIWSLTLMKTISLLQT